MNKFDKDSRDGIIAGFVVGILCCLVILVIGWEWGDELVPAIVESLTRF